MQNKKFLRGATCIAAGGFIAKLIGAAYRIPLLSLIGSQGMGLYQLVYPAYLLLLTVSATGIPSSIAKMVAERTAQGVSDRAVLKTSFKLFLMIGGAGTALMALLSPILSAAQGEKGAALGYLALAPSVVLVSAISVFRGWFQGRGDMRPTALSEVLEQIVKVSAGLTFAYFFKGNLYRTVSLLLFAVTISELVALGYMILRYRRIPAPFEGLKSGVGVRAKDVLSLSLPVALSSMVMPVVGMIESVLIVRLLSTHQSGGVALYGLFSGGAVTLINLPVSLCYGVAVVSVPALSAERLQGGAGVRRRIIYAVCVTLLLSVPCALGLYFLSPVGVRLIYGGLSAAEQNVVVKLTRLLAPSAVTLSCAQTLSACLTGQGKPKFALISYILAGGVRLALDALLIGLPKVSIYGAAAAMNACDLVAFLGNLMYNLIITKQGDKSNDYGGWSWRRKRGFDQKR